MTLILKDRVKETTTTVGLGTISLGGSSDTFEPFSTIGTGNTTYYAIVAEGNDNWEVGVGTVGSGTLSRDIVLASSNLNAKVNFPAGTKDVFVTLPANKIVSKDDATGINSGISLADYVDFDTAAAPATAVGRLFWNDQDGTLDLGLKGGNVTIHIGQKQVIRIVNKIGSSLSAANYQCVKISGAQGQRPKVALAQANNDANSADTIGLVNETIANNQEGFVCTGGTITNINTTGSLQGESWNDGDVLYLSGTVAGRLTNVKPQAPIHTVIVGFVIYAHNNQGKIYVKVDNGYELNELHNVRINGVTNGQVLTYNNGLWENQTNGSGTVTSVSVVSANGLSGSVANSTTTPAITLSTSVSGLLKGSSGALAAASATDVPELPQSKITNLVSDLAAKAPLASPALTGTPTAPTAAVGTNTTQVATTEFVNAEIANDAPSKTGTGASGTWGISVTGNAGTVTNGVYTTGTQTITGNKTFTGSVTMGQSGGGEGGEILWLDPVQGTVCTDIPASGFFRVFQTSGTAKGAYIDLANCAGGVGSLLLHSTNYNSYAPTLTGGGASGSWGISVTGNAGTVTNGVYTTGNQTIGGVKTFSNDIGATFGGQLVLTNSASGATNPNKHFRVGPTGNLEIINSAYNAVPFTFTDAGILSVSAECNAPVFKDVNNSAYYLDPANTGTSMVVAGDVGIGSDSRPFRLTVANNTFDGMWAGSSGTYSFVGLGGYFSGTAGASQIGYERTTGLITFSGGTRDTPVTRMSINSSGNVGIGTTSPGRRLSIAGGGFAFDDANTTSRSVHWGDGTTYPLLIQGDVTNGFISFNTHASGSGPPERLRIDSAGKVLIGAGATASLGKLVVSEASSGTAVIALESQGSWNSTIACTSTGNLVLRNNGASDRMVFDPYGNIITYGPMFASIYYDNDNSAFYVNPNGTSNISALVMNDLLTGRSSSATDVNGANDTGSFSVRGSSSTVASMSFHRTGAYAINMGLGTDNVFRIGGWSASSNAFQMDGSGNLTMLNNVTAYSDARLKTDIVKIENALDKVQQLNGYTYTRTDTGSRQCGVIAQEVMKVLPEVVMGSEETNYSVAYGNMVGLLIEAMKEQQAQIDELKLTIEQLKGN
jgi:hypothetical protein